MKPDPDIERTSPNILAQMLSTDAAETVWIQSDLASLLKFQLLAPLSYDLGLGNPASEERVDQLAASANPPMETFADLLHHPAPPLELLERLKDFAKFSLNADDTAMPQDIATVLYYAAIMAAQTKLKTSISQLSLTSLAEGLQWAIDQKWVDERTRTLFSTALEKCREQA